MSTVQKSNWSRFVAALSELALTCSPLLVLLLALWFFGKLHTILDRTDLALLAAILFADGAFRSAKSTLMSQDQVVLLKVIGLIGALLCTVGGVSVLVAENLDAVEKLAVIARTGSFTYGAFLASLLYSLYARYVAP